MNNFIQRPVLAIVISLIILFLGILAVFRLPMSQFPAIAPPEVNVTVEYAGANAETVTRAAIVPLERAINGVPGMKYMSSDAGNDGVGVIQVIHEVGTDPDIAAVNIQNRVAAVMGELPEEVIKNGVKIAKEENAMLMYLNIFSSDTTLTEKFLYNFADINILTELKRVKGVGYADILGAKEYAMRIWLKPDRMLSYGVGVDDIMEALQAQNIEAAPGKIGENSEKTNFPIQYVIKYPGKYSTEAAYADIPIKSVSDGRMLTIKDVADVEFGTTYFDVEARFNGMPAASIMLKQLPGSNAAEVIGQVKQKMAELKEKTFPQGMDYEVSYDVSKFMEASIRDLLKTVVEAFALVSLVVFVFLQSWRATLIPILAVPISLVGTFFFMQLFGFSVNLITLFALVLAIGIVVDDAIVVVEAVHAELERNRELSPLIATQLAMKKVTRPIIAITLVMSAVFVPAAFLPGPTGIFYRQFSLTVATSIVLSGIVALTLTPALCPLILKRPPTRPASGKLLPRFFGWFNRGYGQMEDKYRLLLLKIVDRRVVTFAVLVLFLLASGTLSRAVPSGFIPDEDQGTFYVSVTSPPGATLERTKETVNEIRSIALELPAVSSVSTLAGTNILSDGTGATYGTCLINLKDWDERHESVSAVMAMLEQKARHIKSAQLEFFPPPAVPGYGNASGFEMRLLDKTGSDDLKQMETVVNDFLSHLKARKEIGSAFTIFDASYPEYMVHVDEHLAAQKGVSVSDIMASLQTLFGSEYATNFIRFGQMYKVMVQASPEYRGIPEDILSTYVKNKHGELVNIGSFIRLEKVYGVDQLTRYNMFPSAEFNGEPAPRYSSGEAIAAIQEVATATLPNGFEIDWAGITKDEVEAGNEPVLIFLICLAFVYLILSGQYESFLLPLPVVFSLPFGVFGALFFLWIFGLENNIYAQIAMVMLIGLLGKNAILIVEYASQRHKGGAAVKQAAVEASVVRLRPILMTSFAFIAGLIPLMTATGVGAVGSRTVGSAAAGGMLFGTLVGVLMVPGFYYAFELLQKRTRKYPVVPAALILLMTLPACSGLRAPGSATVRELPGAFHEDASPADSMQLELNNFFGNPFLRALLDTAFVYNTDLLNAFQNTRIAKANMQLANRSMLPVVQARLNAGLERFGEYTMDGAGNKGTEIFNGQDIPADLPGFYGGFQAAWEADIYGKLKDRKKAALARVLAAEEGARWVQTKLVNLIAIGYYELQAAHEQLNIVRQSIRLQEAILETVRIQKEAARSTELAVNQFEALILHSEAQAKQLEQLIIEYESALNLLVGRYPQPIRSERRWLDETPPALKQGVPSQLLENRPDIKAAEFELAASRFEVSAARKAFFPSLTIDAAIGLEAFSPAVFLKPESVTYGLFGGLLAPVFNRSALKVAFETENALQLQALNAYQQTLLTAFGEVYSTVGRMERIREAVSLKQREIEVLNKAVENANLLFNANRSDYLEVLVVQESLLQARLDLVELKKRQHQLSADLYKALGGGWK